MIGSRRAIVGDEPGITRDRLYGIAHWGGRDLRIVDTGGIVPEEKEFISAEIFRQARVALEEADIVVMVVDGRSELTAPDLELARILLRGGKPLFLAVNRVDTASMETGAEEFRRLGLRQLFPVSAEHGLGVAELLSSIRSELPGTVVFLFQPAEEGAPQGEEGGAALMVKEGALNNPKVDAVFGLHVTSRYPVGEIAYRPGAELAAVLSYPESSCI